jgi:acetyl esterase/lipase
MAEGTGHLVAELHLRGGVTRVHWPAERTPAPPLLVWFADGGSGAGMAAESGVVVVAAGLRGFPAARAVLEWSAAHAASLGADPERLLVGGEGPGAALAAMVASYAREQGWPPVREVTLADGVAQPRTDSSAGSSTTKERS